MIDLDVSQKTYFMGLGVENTVAKIMVVDDTQSVRLLISTIVQEEGHVVYEATTGLEALHRATRSFAWVI